jgi:hypothetical protein
MIYLIFHFSDTIFYILQLAGIVKPHDLQCHLGPSGEFMKYTHDTVLVSL